MAALVAPDAATAVGKALLSFETCADEAASAAAGTAAAAAIKGPANWPPQTQAINEVNSH